MVKVHDFILQSFFVNFIAMISYFARVIADSDCTNGFAVFTTIKYLDYMFTCPLLVYDLLANLEGPFKLTAAGLVEVMID